MNNFNKLKQDYLNCSDDYQQTVIYQQMHQALLSESGENFMFTVYTCDAIRRKREEKKI